MVHIDKREAERSPRRSESLLRRRMSPAVFAVVALAFFLPFATVSCGGDETTFTGIQLVTRSAPPSGDTELDAGIEGRASLALAVLVAAVAGALLGVAGVSWLLFRPGVCATVGLLGTVALPFEPLGPDVVLRVGYLTVLFGFMLLAGLHISLVLARKFDDRKPLPLDR